MIKIPGEATEYILYQRTGYFGSQVLGRFITYMGYIPPFYKLSISLKARFFPKEIKKEFRKEIVKEFDTFKRFLPKKADSILDIGCGVAAFEVLIDKYYNGKVSIFLLDKTHVDENVYYHFHNKGSYYNSLSVAKQLLKLNGVDESRIFTQEATKDNKISFQYEFDAIISITSWGFHYPVSTYLDAAHSKLKKNGVLILDVRKNTQGEEKIREKFGNCRTILDTKKFVRVVAFK